tara:strand:+ start:240 stop:437 length:198 start_codon:yes stop_codon:yes gene_type:complete
MQHLMHVVVICCLCYLTWYCTNAFDGFDYYDDDNDERTGVDETKCADEFQPSVLHEAMQVLAQLL